MSPRVCTVCIHAERESIDKALIDQVAYRTIADRFGPSKAALIRHKAEHLPATMVKAAEQEDVAHAIDVVRQLKAINGATFAILKEAREAKDGELALKAIDRIQRQIELQAKLIGELDERPQVNILVASPEWLQLRARIVAALAPYPEARLAVVGVLS